MVVIHIKKTETDQFLFETTTKESVDSLVRELVAVWNGRHRILRLADACKDLAKHGPLKPADQRGLDEVREKAGETITKGAHYNPDPIGHRTGNAPAPSAAATLTKTAEDAIAAVNKAQVAKKVPLSMAMLNEKIELLRAAVTIAFPEGLPAHETIPEMLDDKEELAGSSAAQDWLDPETATLWWAGKEFFRDKTVASRLGKNEKTKIVARLQPKGSGAPTREPAVSEDERKAMMAHYFKKQEELKKLATDSENDYLHSSWADPKALKRDLLGTGSVKWR